MKSHCWVALDRIGISIDYFLPVNSVTVAKRNIVLKKNNREYVHIMFNSYYNMFEFGRKLIDTAVKHMLNDFYSELILRRLSYFLNSI